MVLLDCVLEVGTVQLKFYRLLRKLSCLSVPHHLRDGVEQTSMFTGTLSNYVVS